MELAEGWREEESGDLGALFYLCSLSSFFSSAETSLGRNLIPPLKFGAASSSLPFSFNTSFVFFYAAINDLCFGALPAFPPRASRRRRVFIPRSKHRVHDFDTPIVQQA